MSSSSDDVLVNSSSDSTGDEIMEYVRDDVAREYRRVLPDEQISM